MATGAKVILSTDAKERTGKYVLAEGNVESGVASLQVVDTYEGMIYVHILDASNNALSDNEAWGGNVGTYIKFKASDYTKGNALTIISMADGGFARDEDCGNVAVGNNYYLASSGDFDCYKGVKFTAPQAGIVLL